MPVVERFVDLDGGAVGGVAELLEVQTRKLGGLAGSDGLCEAGDAVSVTVDGPVQRRHELGVVVERCDRFAVVEVLAFRSADGDVVCDVLAAAEALADEVEENRRAVWLTGEPRTNALL